MSKLTPQQMSAIKQSINLGRQLQIDHPEIVKDYLAGTPQPEIIRNHRLAEEYRVSGTVIASAVQYAFKGYDGYFEMFGIEPYDGLIEDSLYEDLRRGISIEGSRKAGQGIHREDKGIFGMSDERMRKAKSKGGSTSYDRNAGLFAMTDEEREAANRKGGRTAYDKGLGLFGLTPEEREEARLRGITESLGYTLWTYEELQYALKLTQNPNFQHTIRHARHPNYELITEELNRVYHDGKEVRTPGAVKIALFNYRKKL